jgi:hypothetical protein
MSSEPAHTATTRVPSLVPIEGRRSLGTLRALIDIVLTPGLFQVPEQNTCVYLGPRSLIETAVAFQSFFDRTTPSPDGSWPQYPRGGHGPLFASQPSALLRRSRNYRAGNVLSSASEVAPGVAASAGSPVLTVRIGAA